MTPLLSDPFFYLVAIPAVLAYGIAKGGFAGPAAVMAVPLMAMVMSPTQAAAILLPILVVMDVLVVKTYWGIFDKRTLQVMLPGAIAGIVIGYLTADQFNDDHMRIMIGFIALGFGAQSFMGLGANMGREHNTVAGSVIGTIAGFTSFSIHAGGPPFHIYLMPKRLDPLVFAGTAGLFFAVVNGVKLIPYYSLGQLGTSNLLLSLVLIPLAPLGVKIGHWAVKNTKPKLYYKIISFFLMIVGARLLWTGYMALTQS
ncbi:MAG: sulfite exporter TauE/SafE family protein [Halioglobus sp.]